MERNHEIKVLDHGYVRFVDSMGNDEAIVEAARMSTGRGFVSWEPYTRCKKCDLVTTHPTGHGWDPFTNIECDGELQSFPRGDLGILEFLYSNKHMTPFECGGELMIEVQAPIMVFREWHRHRTQSYNEFSARYAQMLNLHYLPDVSRVQKQSKSNKQGSAELLDEREASRFLNQIEHDQQRVYEGYDAWVGMGVAKEVARLNTPVSRYSKMRAKTDLRNWLGFLQLRMAPNAQWEIRQYANAVAEIVKSIWPRTYALFEEHDLHGARLSRTEANEIRIVIKQHAGLTAEHRDRLLKKLGEV